jgi:hypothetical protein
MGDSDFALYLSLLALLVIGGAVVVFIVVWRVRKRAVRVTVGVLLLAVAAVCGILSLLAALVVAALGVGALVLASKMPRSDAPLPREGTPGHECSPQGHAEHSRGCHQDGGNQKPAPHRSAAPLP